MGTEHGPKAEVPMVLLPAAAAGVMVAKADTSGGLSQLFTRGATRSVTSSKDIFAKDEPSWCITLDGSRTRAPLCNPALGELIDAAVHVLSRRLEPVAEVAVDMTSVFPLPSLRC